jgi:hypothetical protein
MIQLSHVKVNGGLPLVGHRAAEHALIRSESFTSI